MAISMLQTARLLGLSLILMVSACYSTGGPLIPRPIMDLTPNASSSSFGIGGGAMTATKESHGAKYSGGAYFLYRGGDKASYTRYLKDDKPARSRGFGEVGAVLILNGIGAHFRAGAIFDEKWALAATLSGGYLWADASIDFSWRMGKKFAMHVSPRITTQSVGDGEKKGLFNLRGIFGAVSIVQLPVGFAVQVGERFAVSAEIITSYALEGTVVFAGTVGIVVN